MTYRIKKGSKKMILFMLTGIFLATLSSYQLFDYLQTNEFISEFPGDWDKPIGISVGLFLILRSLKFVNESKGLFIKIAKNHLVYRTRQSDSVRKISFSDIEDIREKDEKIIVVTKDLVDRIIVDFKRVRIKDDLKESIKKSLNELD